MPTCKCNIGLAGSVFFCQEKCCVFLVCCFVAVVCFVVGVVC